MNDLKFDASRPKVRNCFLCVAIIIVVIACNKGSLQNPINGDIWDIVPTGQGSSPTPYHIKAIRKLFLQGLLKLIL